MAVSCILLLSDILMLEKQNTTKLLKRLNHQKLHLAKVNAASCKSAYILAKKTEDSLLHFTSRNRSSKRSRNLEFSILLGGMTNLRPFISNNSSESVK